MIGRHIAYHGTTMGALSITGVPAIKAPFEPLVPGAVRVPNTNPYRPAPIDPAEAIALAIEMEGPETVAAVFLEPVQNSGGCFPPTEGYFQRVREICDETGVLLVSDEVICAFGRLGHWFGSQRYEYQPDIITMAKGMTSGYSPIGGMIVRPHLVEPFLRDRKTFLHGITFAGHPVSCAVALANLDLMEREGLLEHVRENEGAFRATLEKLHDLPIVGDVRGAGYFYGIELVKDKATQDDVQRRRERAPAARLPVARAVRRRAHLPGRRPRRPRHPARAAAHHRPARVRLHRTGPAPGPHRSLGAHLAGDLRRSSLCRTRSSRCHSSPRARRRSRNGTASNASGPSTPAPDHTPVREQLERDDRVDRGLPHHGLRAVLRHRLVVVGDVVQVHLARACRRRRCRVTHVPAHVRPRMRSPSVAGIGQHRGDESRGETSTPRTRTGAVDAEARSCRARAALR